MKEISSAFIKFQGDLKPVIKGNENPFFKSKYADFSSILEIVLPILSKHGLGVTQTCRVCESGTILQTRVIHESGQEILSECIFPFLQDVQKMGSQLTYYKRYMLQAALGVSTADDDDGNRTKKTIDDSRFKAPRKDLNNFVIKFGKEIKGQTFEQAGPDNVKGLLNWFLDGLEKKGELPKGDVKTFIDNAREYLRLEA